MFEGFTLQQQREIETERGWKPTYSALTYCTAEAVLFRGTGSLLEREILIAERTSGAPDCLRKTQGKWGTYVKPTDRNARYAIQRGLKELFNLDIDSPRLQFAGIVGPELYKATAGIVEQNLTLTVINSQAEVTPFEAKLFCIDLTGLEIDPKGSYSKSTRNTQWVTLDDLVTQQGGNPDFLYWVMVALCVQTQVGTTVCQNKLITEFAPGEKQSFRLY